MFSPKYVITNPLSINLRKIGELVGEFNSLKLTETSLVKMESNARAISSFSSTSIEGNPLALTDVKKILKSSPKNILDRVVLLNLFWYTLKAMKRTILIITFLLVLFGAFFLYQDREKSLDREYPEEFNFIFRYGVGTNELNTFDNTFTKDMVVDPPITVSMVLSSDEMVAVYQKMEILDVFEQTVKSDNSQTTPCVSYYIFADFGFEKRTNSWNDCTGEIGPELEEFASYVMQIIESKPEYIKLPEPKGGYL